MDDCRDEVEISGRRRPYENGYKRCDVCCKHIKTDVLRCYCCGVKMRGKATRSKSRAKRLETVVRY